MDSSIETNQWVLKSSNVNPPPPQKNRKVLLFILWLNIFRVFPDHLSLWRAYDKLRERLPNNKDINSKKQTILQVRSLGWEYCHCIFQAIDYIRELKDKIAVLNMTLISDQPALGGEEDFNHSITSQEMTLCCQALLPVKLE